MYQYDLLCLSICRVAISISRSTDKICSTLLPFRGRFYHSIQITFNDIARSAASLFPRVERLEINDAREMTKKAAENGNNQYDPQSEKKMFQYLMQVAELVCTHTRILHVHFPIHISISPLFGCWYYWNNHLFFDGGGSNKHRLCLSSFAFFLPFLFYHPRTFTLNGVSRMPHHQTE